MLSRFPPTSSASSAVESGKCGAWVTQDPQQNSLMIESPPRRRPKPCARSQQQVRALLECL